MALGGTVSTLTKRICIWFVLGYFFSLYSTIVLFNLLLYPIKRDGRNPVGVVRLDEKGDDTEF